MIADSNPMGARDAHTKPRYTPYERRQLRLAKRRASVARKQQRQREVWLAICTLLIVSSAPTRIQCVPMVSG